MSARAWALYGALLAVGAALSLATRSSTDDGGPELASLSSTRGGGLAALGRYLEGRGATVIRLESAWRLEGVASVVVAAPTARPILDAEVERLKAFARSGGTVIYLAPRELHAQPAMSAWLELLPGPRLRGEALDPAGARGDPAGVTVEVWAQGGLFEGLRQLRTAGGRGVRSDDGRFLPVAGTAESAMVLWRPEGRGQLVVAAGPDFAENRRLELGDNRRFWERLAGQGPVAFDEWHHVGPPAPPISVGLWAFAGQALFAVVFLTLARGTRLGPPRPLEPSRHRAGVEYAQSFAGLLRRARAEPELAGLVLRRLRRIIHDRLGLAVTLPAAELDRELERRLSLERGRWSALESRLRAAEQAGALSPADFAALSADAARLERRVRGAGAADLRPRPEQPPRDGAP